MRDSGEMPMGGENRRGFLRLLTGGLTLAVLGHALPSRAAGGGNPEDPKIRFVKLPVMTLPGRRPYSYVRLQVDLVVRASEKVVAEVESVNAYRPRIVGLVTEMLPQEDLVNYRSGPEQVENLKQRLVEIANVAIGEPLVEEALILSLLVS